MPLILEQLFPLGRFHATRWNQNPFEDRYGEWPPSPWRLLRAIAARWFQYSRETGDESTASRDRLLGKLATCIPQYCLPDLTWRGQPCRQYQPTEVTWTDASKKAAAYKKPRTTLVVDHYRAVPDTVPIYWIFDLQDRSLAESEVALLERLLDRTLYFGRAESHCRMRAVPELPPRCVINCTLSRLSRGRETPVLVPDPDVALDPNILMAASDDHAITGNPIPPGTKWFYAQVPQLPRLSQMTPAERRYPADLRVIQFAVGGRVFPTPDRWIKIAERFRGGVLDTWARRYSADPQARYAQLKPQYKTELALVSGKDADGIPLNGHRHAYFIVWPDDNGDPTRLVVYRDTPFQQDEIEAMLQASERPYSWAIGNPEWRVRLVPLPFSTPAPEGLRAEERKVWDSLTPFVPPARRRRFRENGRERRGEFPDQILRKLLLKQGFPDPLRIEAMHGVDRAEPRTLGDWAMIHRWVYIHETHGDRQRRRLERGRSVRPGYHFRITFAEPVRGPLCIGDSCHFGLGLFVPIDAENALEGRKT